MKVVLSQVPSYLRMLYVFTCFQSMDMFEVCFTYPYFSSKYDNMSVISMFHVCFSYVSRVFKVFFKCFFCGGRGGSGDWDEWRRRRRDVYPARPAARAAEPHVHRARHRERAQGGEGHRAHLCDPPRGSRWRRRAWLWKYFENTWNILENILDWNILGNWLLSFRVTHTYIVSLCHVLSLVSYSVRRAQKI